MVFRKTNTSVKTFYSPIEMKTRSQKPAVDPPDGGWGWFVVFGVFISSALTYGAAVTYPIFYLPLMQEFGIGLGEVTWLTGCYEFGKAFGYLSAPILVDKLGYRGTSLLFSFASSAGICLAAFSPTPIMAYILVGVIPGYSLGIFATIYNVVIVRYFHKRRMLALGLTQTGSAFGVLALAPLLQYLIELYGWRGAVLLLGALSLNCAVASTLYRPIRLKTDESTDKTSGNGMRDILKTAKWCLARGKFWLIATIFVAVYSSWRAYLAFMIPFAQEDLLVSPMQSSLLLSIYSVVNIVSAVAFGALGDLERVNIVWVLIVTELTTAAVSASVWFVGSFGGFLTNNVAHSLMTGPIHTMYVPLLVEVVGENKIQWGVGLTGLMYGVIGSGIVPLIGFLVDTFGNIRLAFLASAILMALSAFLHTPLLHNRRSIVSK